MRICVLYCRTSVNDTISLETAKYFAKGLQENNNSVEIICMNTDKGKSVSLFEYAVVIVSVTGFFSAKINTDCSVFLKSAGSIAGMRCSCFAVGHCLIKQKMLQNLMKILESEGMFLKCSDFITRPESGLVISKNLKTTRN